MRDEDSKERVGKQLKRMGDGWIEGRKGRRKEERTLYVCRIGSHDQRHSFWLSYDLGALYRHVIDNNVALSNIRRLRCL